MQLANRKKKQSTHALHNIFIGFNKYKHIGLAVALAVWCAIPIVGVVFLLLYCQINLSSQQIKTKKKPFLNLIPLVLVVFTIAIYIATFKTFSDTETYIAVYKSLSQESLFSLPNIDMEIGSFVLPKYISIMTGGDRSSFLLFQSLTMNIAFTFYSVIFLPEFYPIVILINIMSQGYYFQLFWMRQFYSFIFVIPAIYTSIFAWRWLLVYLAFLTHSASLIYVLTLGITSIKNIIVNFINDIRKKFMIQNQIENPKFLFLSFSFIFVVLLGPFMGLFLEGIGNSSLLADDITQKIATYANDDDQNVASFTLVNQLRTVLDYVTIFIFVINADYQKENPVFFRWLLLFMTVFGLYLGSFISGFNLRISSIFFCLPGFFYTIPLYSGKFDNQSNTNSWATRYAWILCTSIALRILYFFNSLIGSYQVENYLTFWEGATLTTPITGYFEFLFKCLTGGLKIM